LFSSVTAEAVPVLLIEEEVGASYEGNVVSIEAQVERAIVGCHLAL